MKKKVIVTGANSGIGLASTKLLLKEGYFVFAHYHSSNENLKAIKNDNIYTIKGDFSKTVDIKNVFNKCLEIGKSIDILINNAGTFSISKSIEDIPEKDFNRVFCINVKAPFILSQLALKSMKEKGWGRIVNISSIGVKYGGKPESALYTISKAALETMTISFAKAGAPHNILVNAIRAGVTDTKFHSLTPNKDMKKRIQLIPLKRCATPDEIAKTISFIVSNKSTFTTGSIITVAGGE